MGKYIILLIFFLLTSSNIQARGTSSKNFIYSVDSKKVILPWNRNSLSKKVNSIQRVNYLDQLDYLIKFIAINHNSNKVVFNLQDLEGAKIFGTIFTPFFCQKGDKVINLCRNEIGSFEVNSVLWQFVKDVQGNLLFENQYHYKKQ